MHATRRGPLAPLRRLRPARVLSAVVSTWQNIRPRINRENRQRHRAERQKRRTLLRVLEQGRAQGSPSSNADAGQAPPTLSYMSYDEEFFVMDDSVHPVLREATRIDALLRALSAMPNTSGKVRHPNRPAWTNGTVGTIFSFCRHTNCVVPAA